MLKHIVSEFIIRGYIKNLQEVLFKTYLLYFEDIKFFFNFGNLEVYEFNDVSNIISA